MDTLSALPHRLRDYLTAWNDHDGAAVAGLFADDGTYTDPTLPGPLPAAALPALVDGLVGAFPDLRFDSEPVGVGGDRVTLQWRMRGTNTGPLPGAPALTGATCDLPGVSVVTVGDAGITSVAAYFDQQTFAEQLGLQSFLMPHDDGPMRFGTSVRTDLGRTAVPGALTMTIADFGTVEERAEFEMHLQGVLEAFMAEPSFLGTVLSTSSGRGHTMTAWTSPEEARDAVARSRAHTDGMARVLSGAIGANGLTSVWVPYRINDQIPRCAGCGRKVRLAAGQTTAACECGGSVSVVSWI